MLGPGDVATAPVDGATLAGQQPAKSDQLLSVETYSDGVLRTRLANESFASQYSYTLDVSRDTDGIENGVSSVARFPQGPPAGGRLTLSRFRQDGQQEAVLDLQRFATVSTTSITAVGDPNRPETVRLTSDNAQAVPDQVVQLLQLPAGAPARRVVWTGGPAGDSRAGAPVLGQNVHWRQAPRVFDLTLTQRPQPGSSTPALVSIGGTSISPDPANRIEVSERTVARTVGLTAASLSSQHSLRVELAGEPDDLESFSIARNSNDDNPAQSLQIFVRENGVLTVQAAFLGTARDRMGLEPSGATQLDGLGQDVPQNWRFGVDIVQQDGRPARAALSGENNIYAQTMDVALNDKRQGLVLRLKGLPESWRYELGARFDADGRPVGTDLTGLLGRDNPVGSFDLAYSGARIRAQSLPAEFDYHLDVAGDPADPDGATLAQNDRPQGSGNPGRLLQVHAGTGAVPRFAVTVRGDAAPALATTGSRGEIDWSGAPEDYTLTLARQLAGASGRAVLTGTQLQDTPGSSLAVGVACGTGKTGCPAGTRQELELQGTSTRWSLDVAYGGSAAEPDSIDIRTDDATRHATDSAVIRTLAGGALTQRFVLAGAAALLPTGTASVADGTYLRYPAKTTFRFSRVTNENGSRSNTVATDASVDDALAELRLRQVEDGATRDVLAHGLSRNWLLSATTKGSTANPREIALAVRSSARYASDWIRLLNADPSGTRQRLLFSGSQAAPTPSPEGQVADARYEGFPAKLDLYYSRTSAGGRDTAFDLRLTNANAEGNAQPVPDGILTATLRRAPGAKASEIAVLRDLPAQVTTSYAIPSDQAGAPGSIANCLGDIGYSASSSSLDLNLQLEYADACLSGGVNVDMTDVPSLGFDQTYLSRDGLATIRTKTSGGIRQTLPRLKLNAPLPAGLLERFNNPQGLPKRQFCPQVGEGIFCLDAEITPVNVVFERLRLLMDADDVTEIVVSNSVAQPDYNLHAGEAANRDQPIREALWQYLPIIGIRTAGGPVDVQLTGRDKPGDGSKIVQKVDFGLRSPLPKLAHFSNELVVPDGQALGVTLYSWSVCKDSSGRTYKCNRDDEELRYSKGSFVRTTPGTAGTDVFPFVPQFDYGFFNDEDLDDPDNNRLGVDGSRTTYIVPNPYDGLMGNAIGARRPWSMYSGGYRTDWFWQMLLHVNPTDPLGLRP